jgi:fumarylacetoacetase
LNETHDPTVRSWVDSANHPQSDFPIQNLPFGVYRRRGTEDAPQIGIAIGDYALDLAASIGEGLLPGISADTSIACRAGTLNSLMALGKSEWSRLRRELHDLLRANGPASEATRKAVQQRLLPMRELEMLLPVEIGDYTDFYASIYHATHVGSLFRPENPLMPNYKHLPVAYHGRASSIVVSGTPVRRPLGQSRLRSSEPVRFGPTQQLDYELEMGFFIGPGNRLGQPISMDRAEDSIFGLCLVNDWSARDIQAWEGQPLGPFLAKNFATTISPWVVNLEALAPFRVPAYQRSDGDPELLPYLSSAGDRALGGIDIGVEVLICSERMRQQNCQPLRLSRGNLRDMYWTLAQMLTHHTSNGCNVRTGDLLATGTISGDSKSSLGCLLELTRQGNEPIGLPSGEVRGFLEDGDEVIMRARCESSSAVPIGFGLNCGRVQPAEQRRDIT